MKSNHEKKSWVKPALVRYGDIASLTKGGIGWKSNGTGDDLVNDSLTPFQSCCDR